MHQLRRLAGSSTLVVALTAVVSVGAAAQDVSPQAVIDYSYSCNVTTADVYASCTDSQSITEC